LHGKKIGFEKVIGMIDAMVGTLKQEQLDDDAKKEQCGAELDSADDKKKSLEHALSDLETAIADTEESVATLSADIATLEDEVKALDKSVVEATDARKSENEDYKALIASDSAAKELLAFAKNRLNKFYNPRLFKAAPKRELSEEDRGVLAAGGELETTPAPGGIAGTGITVLAQGAPPPPPDTWGAYSMKSGETTGVIAMIDLLIKDLDKELTEAETEEKDAQGDYATFMADAADSRAAKSKSLTEKTSAKAEAEASLEQSKESKASTENELGATVKSIQAIHLDCDWLLKFASARAEARASEIDALGNAKAVLNGADFS